MSYIRIEGLIIREFPFQEYDRIVSLFTPIEGLIKLFVKGSRLTKKGHCHPTAALNVVEAVYTQGRSELYPCRQIEVINNNLKLRQNLPTLEAACDMLQTILSTQLPGKAAPELYQLLLIYIKKLPEMKDPHILSCSFRLKTLRYEGLLNIDAFETTTLEEQQLIEVLTLCRDLKLLALLEIEESLVTKTKNFFLESI